MQSEISSASASPAGRYWAFISYSHADAKWAEWLHRSLETFPVPRALTGRRTPRGHPVPARLFPIFRDREELPGSANLAANIEEALRGSRYLIVLCSPRSAVSRWVNQEIVTFKALGGADRILCVVLDGEPNATDRPGAGLLECFPPGIRFRVDADGNLTSEREEPIAADAREGKDGRRDALIKLAAGLLGVGFDELKRREETRRRRRRVIWGLAATALAAGAGLAGRQIWAERVRADREAAIARGVNAFLIKDLLQQAGSRQQANASHTPNPRLTVREALERAAGSIGERFREEPLVEAAIREAIGLAFRELGEAGSSIEQLERGLRLREAGVGRAHPDTLSAVESLAFSYDEAGRNQEALLARERVREGREKALGANHPDTLAAMNNLAVSYGRTGRQPDATQVLETVLSRVRNALGREHPDALWPMSNLAVQYDAVGRYADALRLEEEVVRLRRQSQGPAHPDTLDAMNNLAVSLQRLGRGPEALRLREEVWRVSTEVLGPEHPATIGAKLNLANSYQRSERGEDARRMYGEVVRARRAQLGEDHPDTLSALNNLAASFTLAGQEAEGLGAAEEVLRLTRGRYGPDGPETLEALAKLATFQLHFRRTREAIRALEELVAARSRHPGERHFSTLTSVHTLGVAYQEERRLEDAIRVLARAAALCREELGPDHPTTLEVLVSLAQCHREAGRPEEALRLLRSAPSGPAALSAGIRYELACAEARAGNLAEAKRLIAEEIAEQPGVRSRALEAESLRPIREFIATLP
jgi:hypothetical protein